MNKAIKKIDSTKILADFDISLMKLRTTITLFNLAIGIAGFCGDYSIAKNAMARNRDLSSYYKRLSKELT